MLNEEVFSRIGGLARGAAGGQLPRLQPEADNMGSA